MTPERAAFAAAVRGAAFRREGDDGEPDPELLAQYPGGVVHSFAGAIGADWSADSVVAAVERAHDVAWEPGAFMRHELRVELRDGPRVRVLHFDVPAPAGVPVWLVATRSDGDGGGKLHAALEGQTRARCGTPVRPARGGALGQPFRPGPSRCAGCARLIAADSAAPLDNPSSPSKVES